MFKYASIPFPALYEQDPQIAKSILQRYGMGKDEAQGLHVLILVQPVNEWADNGEHGYIPRSVSTVMLLSEPANLSLEAVGTSIKNPIDREDPEIGLRVALSRAVRRYVRRKEYV